jgi:acyl dehydratase
VPLQVDVRRAVRQRPNWARPVPLEIALEAEDVIARFSIDWAQQERFAHLTGDWNPVHVDRDFARRTPFGDAVVHGMNTTLTALEHFCANAARECPLPLPVNTTIQFPRPVFISDSLRLVRVSQTTTRLRLAVRSGETDLVKISIAFQDDNGLSPAASAVLPASARQAPSRRAPTDRSMADGMGLTLELPLAVDAAALADTYPGLINWLGERRVAGMALLSTVVGMEWPGLRSLFTEAAIRLTPFSAAEPDRLVTRVLTADAERGMTSAETTAPGLVAETAAFFRPPPVVQPSFAELQQRVGQNAFKGWSAVVVGGSRGLGEIAAKLLAAGGADVVVTYRSGRAQAEAVWADIVAGGGRCALVPYDAGVDGLRLPDPAKPGQPVLLFYSASPHIFRRRTQAFSRVWLDEFVTVYVDGFLASLQAVRNWTTGPVSVLYPSTQALDESMPTLVEYAAAKAAGEAACRSVVGSDKRMRLDMPRLPRLLTDQTNSIIPVETADPVDLLLPILERLAEAR